MKITKQVYDKIERGIKHSWTNPRIATQVGCSEQTITRVRKSENFDDYRYIASVDAKRWSGANRVDVHQASAAPKRKKFLGIF